MSYIYIITWGGAPELESLVLQRAKALAHAQLGKFCIPSIYQNNPTWRGLIWDPKDLNYVLHKKTKILRAPFQLFQKRQAARGQIHRNYEHQSLPDL